MDGSFVTGVSDVAGLADVMLETEFFFDNNHCDALRAKLAVDDQNLVHACAHVVKLLHMFLLKRIAIFLNAPKAFVQVLDDLL